MSNTVGKNTLLYRLVHIDNLAPLLQRGALHAPNRTPDDGLPYRTIHDVSVQANRHLHPIPCGPGGTVHDYVPFYFGPLSVMLLKLKSGQVEGYNEGQQPLVYLVAKAESLSAAGCRFVFSDGHGLARFTGWYDDLARLDAVDWSLVGERYWSDQPEDNDRQRRKQAEFLVWQELDWALIAGIAVCNEAMRLRVEEILQRFPQRHQPPVKIMQKWYY